MEDKPEDYLKKEIACLAELRRLNNGLFRHFMGLLFELVHLLRKN